MNLNEIKEIIKKDQGKFIIIEDGKPIMVILSFGDYQKILNLTPRYQKIGGEAEEKEEQKSERFVPIGETIEISKEDFVSEALPEDTFPEEDKEGEDIPPELESSFAEPSEDKDEPMKIEDLPF